MTPHYSTQYIAARGPSTATNCPPWCDQTACAREEHEDRGAVCALFGLASSVLVAPTGASATPSGRHSFPPGSVVVSQGGTLAGDGTGTTGVEALGAVNVYPPNANGDVAPKASFTKGMNGPFTVVFDPSGDLWAANVNNSTLVEFTRAQLATRNPSPAVTISSASGALNFIASMAFDSSGNLWVVVNNTSGRGLRVCKMATGQFWLADARQYPFGLPEPTARRRF